MYSFGNRETERRAHNSEGDVKASVYCFTPQTPAIAGPGKGWNPGTLSLSPTWVSGAQVVQSPSVAFPSTLAARWIRSTATWTWTGPPFWDSSIASSNLTHCATILALFLSISVSFRWTPVPLAQFLHYISWTFSNLICPFQCAVMSYFGGPYKVSRPPVPQTWKVSVRFKNCIASVRILRLSY